MRITNIFSSAILLFATNIMAAASKPTKFGVILYDGIQLLDTFGPLDTLYLLSLTSPIELSLIASSLHPVNSTPKAFPNSIGARFLPTHTFETAPNDIEVLLVPGGTGTRDLEATQPAADFVKAQYPKLQYLLTVCTGSALTARTGILDGKNATTNKRSWEWATGQGPKVNWIRKARWVTDGNIYTSSGVSAGIDMFYAFLEDVFGKDVADTCAKGQEYIRNTDPHNDPFAPKDA